MSLGSKAGLNRAGAAVFIGNLVLLGTALLVKLVLVQQLGDSSPVLVLAVQKASTFLYQALSFPLGWLTVVLFTPAPSSPVAAGVTFACGFLLNAYLWGKLVASCSNAVSVWRRIHNRDLHATGD